MLLRRLSLSHANKPRKRYEGYANAKKNAGVGHDGVRLLMGSAPAAWPERPSTMWRSGLVGKCAWFRWFRCAVLWAPYSGVREHPFRRGDPFGRPSASQTLDPASRDARYRRIAPRGPRRTCSPLLRTRTLPTDLPQGESA